MKTQLLSLIRATAILAAVAFVGSARAERVGTYDSRVVAFACYNSPDHLAALKERMQEGKAARDRGDQARYEAIEREMIAEQKKMSLQVFSNAPAPEALGQLQTRVEAVQREAGVARLVSKWDKVALKDVPEADRIDVTDLLVRDLPLTEKQRESMRKIAATKPLPQWQMKLLNLFGKA